VNNNVSDQYMYKKIDIKIISETNSVCEQESRNITISDDREQEEYNLSLIEKH
jgi:hypothetical protein